jgi:uncharacterized protein (DUF362 family)
MDRRQFLKLSAAGASASWLAGCETKPRWEKAAFNRPPSSRVAILAADSYAKPLRDTIRRGLDLFRLDVRGKRVLLKPNLVEFDPNAVINTHPAMIEAAIEAFKSLDAREVIVGEGPGHRRDNEYLLTASGLLDVVRHHRVDYVDLNTDDVRPVPLKSHYTNFPEFYLPETLLGVDLLVSLPKLKTHHWAGVTLSMKNMFGVIPSAVYGWPKNALHWAGLHQSIVDINSSLPVRRFAIVDGIVGMDGNGPLHGQAKPAGVLVFGEDPVAVDATAARLMMIEPRRVKHLQVAGQFLGNLAVESIEQVGERIDAYRKDFAVLSDFADLKKPMS